MAVKNFVDYNNATSIVNKIGKKLDSLQGGLHYRGSIEFANLPNTLTKAMSGYLYNITNDFTTDARFVEGAGKKFPAGTDVAVADQSTYDAVTPVGSENPSTSGWYELVDGRYVRSTDTTVESGKTYYEYNEVLKFNVGSGFVDTAEIHTRIDNVRNIITDSEFEDTVGYVIGDIVTYKDHLYKFKAAHTAGSWDSTEVDEITVLDLIESAEPDSLTTEQVSALLALLD